MAASVRPGMGALPYGEGVTFRVWAPFASSVCVAGSFNGWSVDSTPLTPEGNSYWSVDGLAPAGACMTHRESSLQNAKNLRTKNLRFSPSGVR
jgi:1,4-alpha-glucan branching enzyme